LVLWHERYTSDCLSKLPFSLITASLEAHLKRPKKINRNPSLNIKKMLGIHSFFYNLFGVLFSTTPCKIQRKWNTFVGVLIMITESECIPFLPIWAKNNALLVYRGRKRSVINMNQKHLAVWSATGANKTIFTLLRDLYAIWGGWGMVRVLLVQQDNKSNF